MRVGSGRLTASSSSGTRAARAACAVHFQHLGDLLADAHQRVQRGHRLLEDHADARAAQGAQRGGRQAQQVGALKVDDAALHAQRRRQQAHDRGGADRLAGAALADDAQDLARFDSETDVADGFGAVAAGRQGEVRFSTASRLIGGAPGGG